MTTGGPGGGGPGGPLPPGGGPTPEERATITEADVAAQQQMAEMNARMTADLALQLEKQKEKIELQERALRNQGQLLEAGKKQVEIQTLLVRKMQDLAAAGKSTAELEAEFNNLSDSMNLSAEAMAEFARIMAIQNPAEKAQELEKYRAKLEDVSDISTQVTSGLGKFADILGVTADASQTTMGSMIGFASSLAEGFSEDKFTKIAEGVQTMLHPFNVFGVLIDKIKDAAFELDKVGAAFSSATGFGRGFEGEIMKVHKATVLSGVSMQEAQQALQALATEFSGFAYVSETTRVKLTQNIALLEKIGVSGGQSAKIMDNLARSFRMSGEQAADLTRELITSGQAAGITASKMAADFQSSFGTLAQYGSQATEIFKGMAAQARATGIEMGQLISMVQKFDTFEGATSAAASLNAVLGTQLSSIELLNADYEERVNLLRTGIQSTVGSFDSMDRFTQMYVAQAIGAKDVAEAQKLINMSTAEYASYKNDMATSAKTQEQLAAAAEQLVPIMERFKLAVAGIVLQFSWFIEGASAVMEFFTQWQVLLPTMIGGLVLLGFTMQASFGKWAVLGTLLYGIIQLLSTQINPVFVAAFHFMAVGLLQMGIAAQVGGFKLVLLVAALGLVFGAIALVIYAISEVIDSITGLFALMIDSAAVLPQTAMGIYLVAGAVGALGLATMLSLGSVLLLMSALTGIGAVIAGVGMVTGISALGEVASHIASVGDGLNKFAQSMTTIKSAVAEIKALGGGGFIAATVEGNKTSMVVANKETMNTIQGGEIKVSVDMPDIKIPAPVVHVYIDGQRQTDAIVKVVTDRLVGA